MNLHNFKNIVLTTAVASALIGAIYLIYLEGEKWGAFKKEHNCVKVGFKDATIMPATTITLNGGVATTIVTTPSETAWKCDDGVTYWKRT